MNERKLLLATLIGTFLLSDVAFASDFIKDSTWNSDIYLWSRDRTRKDVLDGDYKDNLEHTTMNFSLGLTTGYIADFLNFDFGAYAAWEPTDGGPAYPNEIGLSNAKTRWDETWNGDRSGFDYYRAAMGLKFGDWWAKIGFIQPSGQTLLAPHWSFLPGTYRGFEIGTKYDFGQAGELFASYMWSDKYKAPWYTDLYDFYEQNFDDGTLGRNVKYLHSLGVKYDFKNNLVLETAFGQAEDYMNQYLTKLSYALPVFNETLRMSYQFYGAKDQGGHGAQNVYDGLAWLQALSFGYKTGPIDWQFEAISVRARGKQGYFLQRMTPQYASSNGRLDVWWNSRSDFNADGEKGVFLGFMYDLSKLIMPGLKAGSSYAYAWDARPNSMAFDQDQRVRESAWNLDLAYQVPNGYIKGTSFALHYTMYDNHSSNPSYGNGYANMFQDEHDLKFIVSVPFSTLIKSAKEK